MKTSLPEEDKMIPFCDPISETDDMLTDEEAMEILERLMQEAWGKTTDK